MKEECYDGSMTPVLNYLQLFVLFTALQVIRYFAFAGGAHLAITRAKESWSKAHRIQTAPFLKADLVRESKYSLFTILIYSAVYAFVFHPEVLPHTATYWEVSERGWIWTALSFPALILIHDTYFYWMHRFLHIPAVFSSVHRIHHLSTNPSALSAQSFHPFEAFLEVIWIVPVVFFLPLHLYVMIAFSFFSLGSNIFGHSGVETLPPHLAGKRALQWMNTSTHHNGHHRYYRGNYSLYFRFWDRWMKTSR